MNQLYNLKVYHMLREEAPPFFFFFFFFPPAEEKLGENKFGMSVWRKGDGTFVKRYADGRPEEGITSTVADLLTKQGAWKPAETSEAEKIREAAQAEAERLKPHGARSETPEEKAAAEKQAEADRLVAERVATDKEAGPKVKPPAKKKSKRET